MSCEQTRTAGTYIDGAMSEADRSAFAAHLGACAECSAEVARLQRMRTFLQAAQMPQMVRPRAAFEAQLNSRRVLRFAEILMSAAAVVILVCGIWLMKTEAPGNVSQSRSVPNWERMALGQKLEPSPASESDDPLVQVLFRE